MLSRALAAAWRAFVSTIGAALVTVIAVSFPMPFSVSKNVTRLAAVSLTVKARTCVLSRADAAPAAVTPLSETAYPAGSLFKAAVSFIHCE